MATVNVRLKPQPRSDGSHPINVRVTHDRQTKAIHIDNVQPDQWDDKRHRVKPNHPHWRTINKLIEDKVKELTDRIYSLELNRSEYNLDDILWQGSTRLADVVKRHAQSADLSHMNRRKFQNLHKRVLNFDPLADTRHIDRKWMDRFKTFLFKQPTINSINTIHAYIKFLKTVLNTLPYFHNKEVLRYSVPQRTKGNKVKLTKDEVQRIREVELKGKMDLCRDVFLAQIELRGTRIRDVLLLTPNNIHEDRLVFFEQKTGKVGVKGNERSMRITDRLFQLIDKYKGQGDYLFPLLTKPYSDPKKDRKFYKHIDARIAFVNKYLKIIAHHCGITKSLSTHVARHTVATWAAESGMTNLDLMNFIGHSSIKETEKYIESLRQDSHLDDLADKVLD